MDAVAIVPFAELRLQNRPIRFALIRIANVLLNVGLNLVLILGMGMGIEAVFVANAAASLLSVLLLSPQYARLLAPAFDRRLWREMMAFGLPFVPGGLGYAVCIEDDPVAGLKFNFA